MGDSAKVEESAESTKSKTMENGTIEKVTEELTTTSLEDKDDGPDAGEGDADDAAPGAEKQKKKRNRNRKKKKAEGLLYTVTVIHLNKTEYTDLIP